MLTRREREDLVSVFEEIDNTYTARYLFTRLKQKKVSDPELIINQAFREGLMYADSIRERGKYTMLALSKLGESEWEKYQKKLWTRLKKYLRKD